MPREISLKDVRGLIGQEIGISDWITVTQKTIDGFADATDDHQFIHSDPVRAAAETRSAAPSPMAFCRCRCCRP